MQRAAHINNYSRSGTAGAIALLHAAAVYMLTSTDVVLTSETPKGRTLTWLELPALNEPEPRIVVPRIRQDERPHARAPQRATPAAPPAITQPTPDANLNALRSYVWCGALDDGKTLDTKKPCDKLHLNLHDGAVPERVLTAKERALAKKFARDKAVADAPILLPCASPDLPLSLMCLATLAVGGDLRIGSDAHSGDATRCDPRFSGAEQCRGNFFLQSFSPTNR